VRTICIAGRCRTTAKNDSKVIGISVLVTRFSSHGAKASGVQPESATIPVVF